MPCICGFCPIHQQIDMPSQGCKLFLLLCSAGSQIWTASTVHQRLPLWMCSLLAGLLKWVLAMVNYYDVAKGVEPKRKKVAEAEKNLRLAQKDLVDTKDKLAQLNAQLTTLRSQFADKTAEQQDLKAKAELMERRLIAAERLIAGLGSEKERWAKDIQALEAAKERLVGDCLLCSSFLSYTGMALGTFVYALASEASACAQHHMQTPLPPGNQWQQPLVIHRRQFCQLPQSKSWYFCKHVEAVHPPVFDLWSLSTGAFTFKYRSAMVYDMWQSDLLARKIPLSQPFKLETIMTNDVETTAWASEGLPGDELSVQNGLLTTHAARWPLCIDPQMQAVAWIKRKEGKQLEGKVRGLGAAQFKASFVQQCLCILWHGI